MAFPDIPGDLARNAGNQSNVPSNRGVLPVILATPIPKTSEFADFANHLRRLVHGGFIDLRIPKLEKPPLYFQVSEHPFAYSRPFDESMVYDAAFFGVEPTQSVDLDSFFRKVDSELSARDRKAVVVFGSATSKKKLVPDEVEIPLLPEASFYGMPTARIDERINFLQGEGVFPEFPIIKEGYSSIGAQVDFRPTDLSYWDRVFSSEELVASIASSIPTLEKPDRVLKKKEIEGGIIFRNQNHFMVVDVDTRRVGVTYAELDIEEQIRKGLLDVSRGPSRFSMEHPLPWDENYPTFHARNAQGLFQSLNAGVSRIGYRPLPDFESLKQLDVEIASAEKEAKFWRGIDRDVKFASRIHEASKVVNVEMSKAGMALVDSYRKNRFRDPIDNVVWDVTAIAETSRKLIDSIRSQYGAIDNPEMPFDDALRLSSAFIVHRKATDLLENMRCVQRGEESFQRTLKKLEKITPDIASKVVPIPDEAVARLAVNVAILANLGTDEQRAKFDQVDTKFGRGIRELIDVAEGVVAKAAGERDLIELEAEPTASQRAASLPRAIAKMSAPSTSEIIRAEIEQRSQEIPALPPTSRPFERD